MTPHRHGWLFILTSYYHTGGSKVFTRTLKQQEEDYPKWVTVLKSAKRVPTLKEWGTITKQKGNNLLVYWHFLKANSFVHPQKSAMYNVETLLYNMSHQGVDLLVEDVLGRVLKSSNKKDAVINAVKALQGIIPLPSKISEEIFDKPKPEIRPMTNTTTSTAKTKTKTTTRKSPPKRTTSKKKVSASKESSKAVTKKTAVKKAATKKSQAATKKTAGKKQSTSDISGMKIVSLKKNPAREGTVRHTLMAVIMKCKSVDNAVGTEYEHEGKTRKVATIDIRVAEKIGAIALK